MASISDTFGSENVGVLYGVAKAGSAGVNFLVFTLVLSSHDNGVNRLDGFLRPYTT